MTATSIKWKEGMGISNGGEVEDKGNKRSHVEESCGLVVIYLTPDICVVYESSDCKLYVKMVVNRALKRFKMSGGEMKVKTNDPFWKSMRFPQQSGDMDHDFYVMRFMHDIVKNCSTISDLDKVWISHKEERYNYSQDELNDVRNKWASYFTSHCT